MNSATYKSNPKPKPATYLQQYDTVSRMGVADGNEVKEYSHDKVFIYLNGSARVRFPGQFVKATILLLLIETVYNLLKL